MLQNNRKCAVCGDVPAKVHYGVLACFGCKGFFRRAVKEGRNKYACRFDKNCQVTKHERNSCRYCRFRKCLLVGMNPDYVRPDREENSPQKSALVKKRSLGKTNSVRFGDTENWQNFLLQSQRKLMSNLNDLDMEFSNKNDGGSFENVSSFCLKSLIADRTLSRGTQPSSSNPSTTKRSPRLLSIDRVVSVVDYVDGFVRLVEGELRKTSIEDKSSLISNCALNCILLDSAVQLVAKGANITEEFARLLPNNEQDVTLVTKFACLCDSIKNKSPSAIELSLMRAFAISVADTSVLSNSFGSALSAMRESLQELLFRAIKHSQGRSSSSAANQMANAINIVYTCKDVASEIRAKLSSSYPRNEAHAAPFNSIFCDILNPEVSDLLLTVARPSATYFSAPNIPSLPPPPPQPPLHPTAFSAPTKPPEFCSFAAPNLPQNLPPLTRPTHLTFNAKLPLTLTKSIEEILRPPGMTDDANIMNRPLACDWADGMKLTPVFNKDIVAQFFPEYI